MLKALEKEQVELVRGRVNARGWERWELFLCVVLKSLEGRRYDAR